MLGAPSAQIAPKSAIIFTQSDRKWTGRVSRRLASLSNRLARVEQRLADKMQREGLADCICKETIVALQPDDFEAEMNRECPVHGLRELSGNLIRIHLVDPDPSAVEDPRMDELMAIYDARLVRQHAALELKEDESEEF